MDVRLSIHALLMVNSCVKRNDPFPKELARNQYIHCGNHILHITCVPAGVVVVPMWLGGKDESLGVTNKILVSHMLLGHRCN